MGKQYIQAKEVYSLHFETIQDSREVIHSAENGPKLREFPFPKLSTAVGLAQSVERLTAEREVAGSIPGADSDSLRVLK